MSWPDAISEGLPSPRDDEPAQLRRDILDELCDHLQTSLEREVERVPDVTQARRNVLARFGDPRRVMYELWFQAMKERIMSQRLMLILCSIMAVACLVALGMTWRLVRQSHDTQSALLDKIAAMVAPQGAADGVSSEWSRVQIQLILDDDPKSPATGFLVSLTGYLQSEKEQSSLQVGTDSQGVADFGLVRAGQISLGVDSPEGEHMNKTILVRRGQAFGTQIVCPVPRATQGADVRFSIRWPDDLRDQDLWLLCDLEISPRYVGDAWWSPLSMVLTFNNKSQVIGAGTSDSSTMSHGFYGTDILRFTGQMLSDNRVVQRIPDAKETCPLRAVEYTIASMAIVRPAPGSSQRPAKREDTKVLVATGREEFSKFTPIPGQSNEWTIELPEKLVEQMRRRLAESTAQPTAAPSWANPSVPKIEMSLVKVKLTLEDKQQSPARGFRVRLTNRTVGGQSLDAMTDAQGVADFGSVQMGEYGLEVRSASGASMYQSILVRPGQETERRISCPLPFDDMGLAFSVAWPDDLVGKGLWAVCWLAGNPLEVAGQTWNPSYYAIVVVDAEGRIHMVRPTNDRDTHFFEDWTPSDAINRPDMIREFFRGMSAKPLSVARLPGIGYTVKAIAIAKPGPNASLQSMTDGATRLATTGFKDYVEFTPKQPVDVVKNRWKIPLPDSLIEQVQQKLASSAEQPTAIAPSK